MVTMKILRIDFLGVLISFPLVFFNLFHSRFVIITTICILLIYKGIQKFRDSYNEYKEWKEYDKEYREEHKAKSIEKIRSTMLKIKLRYWKKLLQRLLVMFVVL